MLKIEPREEEGAGRHRHVTGQGTLLVEVRSVPEDDSGDKSEGGDGDGVVKILHPC